jgi:PKHD-type hydroxylase
MTVLSPFTTGSAGSTGFHLDLVHCPALLDSEDCDSIERLGRSFPLGETTVVSQERLNDHRVCQTHMIGDEPRSAPLYNLLESVASDASARHYGLELGGVSRMPHYVEYHAGKGHFHWHNDYSHESEEAPRKLTIVIQLSDPDDYSGGLFETFGPNGIVANRERGTIFCLPSFVPHRVTAVTRGVRKALVAWVSGPRLR